MNNKIVAVFAYHINSFVFFLLKNSRIFLFKLFPLAFSRTSVFVGLSVSFVNFLRGFCVSWFVFSAIGKYNASCAVRTSLDVKYVEGLLVSVDVVQEALLRGDINEGFASGWRIKNVLEFFTRIFLL